MYVFNPSSSNIKNTLFLINLTVTEESFCSCDEQGNVFLSFEMYNLYTNENQFSTWKQVEMDLKME